MESNPWELSNGMSHYPESALHQKLQKRSVIQKSYLHAHIFASTNTKGLGKRFFWSINKLQSIYIYCLLWIQNLIFDILMYLKWVQVVYTEKESYRKSFVTSSCKGRKCSIDEHSWYFKYSIWCSFLFTFLGFNYNTL